MVNHVDSLALYEGVLRFLRPMFWMTGLNVFDANYRFKNTRSIFSIFLVVTLFSSLCYTLYVYSDNFVEAIKSASSSGPILLVVAKLFVFGSYHRQICDIHNEIVKLHCICRERYSRVLHKWTRRIKITVWCQSVLYCSTGFFYLFGPIVIYALYSEKVLVIPIEVPFIDSDTLIGFIVTSGYEVVCSVLAVLMLCSTDALLIVFSFTGAAYAELVALKCENFTRIISRHQSDPDKVTEEDVINALKETIIVGQSFDRLMKSICNCFQFSCFMQIYTSGFCLGLSLVAGKLTTWFVAYFLAACCLFTLSSYSAIGTLIQIKSEELSMRIYDINWYMMPLRGRKMYVIMLQQSQRGACIYVMGSKIMNVELGLDILKNIYTMYMMMLEAV